MHWEFQSSILTNSRKKNVIHQWMLDTLQSTLDIESVCLGKLSYSPKLKIMFGHLRDVSSMLEHVKKWHVFQDWKIPRKKNICIYNIIYIYNVGLGFPRSMSWRASFKVLMKFAFQHAETDPDYYLEKWLSLSPQGDKSKNKPCLPSGYLP